VISDGVQKLEDEEKDLCRTLIWNTSPQIEKMGMYLPQECSQMNEKYVSDTARSQVGEVKSKGSMPQT